MDSAIILIHVSGRGHMPSVKSSMTPRSFYVTEIYNFTVQFWKSPCGLKWKGQWTSLILYDFQHANLEESICQWPFAHFMWQRSIMSAYIDWKSQYAIWKKRFESVGRSPAISKGGSMSKFWPSYQQTDLYYIVDRQRIIIRFLTLMIRIR